MSIHVNTGNDHVASRAVYSSSISYRSLACPVSLTETRDFLGWQTQYRGEWQFCLKIYP